MGSKWLHVSAPPCPKQRLVCFPYAGGSASLFNEWRSALGDGVELCAVELPGRRRRHREPPASDIASAACEVEYALRGLPPLPTVIFGHSMGGLMAFELAHHWSDRRTGPLDLLVVSGCRAPHLRRREPAIHALPRQEFVRALSALGGTPPELLQNEQIMSVVEPVLRADMKLVETYAPRIDRPLDVPLRVLGGDADPTVSSEALSGWLLFSRREATVHSFPGNHFFLHSSGPMLLDWLRGQLARVRPRHEPRPAATYFEERA